MSKKIFLGTWASRFARGFATSLASGYPLHHLRSRFAPATVVPLLSLSQLGAIAIFFLSATKKTHKYLKIKYLCVFYFYSD
jgi:hypothetical protein